MHNGFTAPNSCSYDPDGRLYQSCGGAAFSLLGNNAIRDQITGWFYVYEPGIDNPLLAIRRAQVTLDRQARLQMESDGHGQLVAIADSSGALLGTFVSPGGYAPGTWATSGITTRAQTFDPRRLATDTGSDISTFRTRQYDPGTGSWMQEDHAGLAGGTNLYQYNGNDPNSFRDPLGTTSDSSNQTGSSAPADTAKVKSCTDRHRLSELFGGGAATQAVRLVEIPSLLSLSTDIVGAGLKAANAGTPTANVYASGARSIAKRMALTVGHAVGTGNAQLGRIVGGIIKVTDVATPAMAVVGVFSLAYNLTTDVECRTGVIK